MTRRGVLFAGVVTVVWGVVASSASCASLGPPAEEHRAAAAVPAGEGASAFGPARYLVPDSSTWVERASDGLDRIVVNGCRIEARGASIVRTGPAEPEVEAGIAMPAWIAPAGVRTAGSSAPGGATVRYLFWKGKEVYGAQSFMGELTRVATLRADVVRAFDWIDGAGLLTADGVTLVRASDSAAVPFSLPGVVDAVAADARQAVALTIFGHTRLTQDGGASFRDVSGEVGEPRSLDVRGSEIALALQGDRRRYISASGVISDTSAAPGPKRGARPPDLDDKWPPSASSDALEALVGSGVPLADGGVVVASRGVVGRFDVGEARAVAATELSEAEGSCAPIRVPGALLLVCEGKERATILDVTGEPRVERTFDLAGAADYDRFSGTDGESLGFLGPCDGTPPRLTDIDIVTSATPYNASTAKSPVFCVRKSRDVWVEHRLDPADAPDVIAWIPQRGGAAVALVARPGNFIDDAERVSVRGLLRVVRVARSEPPLALPQYGARSAVLLSRALRALPDGTVEGWLPTVTYPSNTIAVAIDPAGHVRVRSAPPRAGAVAASGAFAVAQTEDGALYETIDWGRRWLAVARPPGSPLARLSTCSPAGCRIGPFVRLGWSSADPREKPVLAGAIDASASDSEASLRILRNRQYKRPSPSPPIVRLRCAFAGAGEGTRIPDSYGFGVTKTPAPRTTMPSRIASLGTLILPWNGSQVVIGGDAEVAWVSPLDLAAQVRRVTLPVSRFALELRNRPYDVRVGYVIDAEGRVRPIAAGPKESCLASLFDEVGLTRPAGGCAPDPAIGVDLGGRMVLLNASARFGGLTISVVDTSPGRAPGGAASVGGAPSMGLVQREIYRTPVAQGAYGYTFGAGSRGGVPVVVAVDGRGDAVLAPVDSDRGTFGVEERLAPLTAVALGTDPSCAPRPDQARVVVPLDSQIGLDRASMSGVAAAGTFGLAVIRWSPSRACLDAVELTVRDERHELDLGYYEPPGTLRKLIARFGSPAERASAERSNGTLALILYGAELRQKVSCTGIGP